MVLFIAGDTHSGKTLLAQRLLERHGFPYLSLDHLKMGLIRSGLCPLSPESPDSELTAFLWPTAREIAKTAIENRQNLIIEGCYIPFDFRKDFSPEYLKDIRFVCIVLSERYIEENFSSIKAHASDIETRQDDGYLDKASLIAHNAANLADCRARGLEYILVDGEYGADYSIEP